MVVKELLQFLVREINAKLLESIVLLTVVLHHNRGLETSFFFTGTRRVVCSGSIDSIRLGVCFFSFQDQDIWCDSHKHDRVEMFREIHGDVCWLFNVL